MRKGKIGCVTYTSCQRCKCVREIITDAIKFLHANLEFNDSELDCHCIVSDNYYADIRKYHGDPEAPNTANGIFIPSFYQRKSIGKPILIFNWSKIGNALNSFVTSVFTHELVHVLDYQLCEELEKKYGKIFMLHVEPDTLEDWIGGLHQMRSEMRAKYFQEKYECSLLSQRMDIHKRITHRAAKVSSVNDYYNIAHLTGQLLCWQEYVEKYPGLQTAVSAVNETLAEFWSENPNANFKDVFAKEDFLAKCEEISQETPAKS